jgi:hypothetical protein
VTLGVAEDSGQARAMMRIEKAGPPAK